ncbi:MAG: diguanylate cyclase [Burkholderiaceae bacterium]
MARAGARDWWIRVLLLALAYYLGGRIGLAVPHTGHATSALLIWPPAGIALAVLTRFGRGLWPGVWLGSLCLLLGLDVPGWAAILITTGNTLGALLGASLLRRGGLHIELDRRRDLWLYCLIGVGYAMLLTAGNTTLWLAASGLLAWHDAPQAWMHEWLGDAIGALLVGIPLLTLSRAALRQAFGGWRAAPSGLIALGALASAALTFGLPAQDHPTRSVLMFAPHVLLCWLAARSGLFAAASTALLLSGGAVMATASGWGPFHAPAVEQDLGMLVSYVCGLVVIPLLTTALAGELAANEKRWQLALDTSDIGIAEWDLDAGRISFSARWQALLGHAAQESGDAIDAFWALIHPDDTPRVQQAFEPLRMAGRVNCRASCRLRSHDGGWRWFELNALVAERAADGEPVRILSTARDIGDLQATRERQHLSDNLFQHLHEGLLVTDLHHRILEANPTFTEITGYAREELLGTVPSLLRSDPNDPHAERQQAAIRAGLAEHGIWRGEVIDRRRNGETCLLQLTVSRVPAADGGARHHHMLAITDITRTRQQLEQLQRQAHFDELTRLPNRVRLAQMLQEAMQTSQRERSLLTVCYLDLDHFKPVNDRFGHDAGDRLLLELANRMRRSLRSWAGGDDVVARIGGDEFVLLLRTTRWRKAVTRSSACCTRSASPTPWAWVRGR